MIVENFGEIQKRKEEIKSDQLPPIRVSADECGCGHPENWRTCDNWGCPVALARQPTHLVTKKLYNSPQTVEGIQ